MIDDVVIIIPAYNPDGNRLLTYLSDLIDKGFSNILIINDGSQEQHTSEFQNYSRKGCTVITHENNLGKGAALKTAYKYLLKRHEDLLGVITVDSDGQHTSEDVKKIYDTLREHPTSLILGCRDFFNAVGIPEKSLVGNRVTIKTFELLYGKRISDTQTGLRGIPFSLLKRHLNIQGNRFQYEMNVLIDSVVNGINIVEVPIKTVYFDNNSETHFRPIIDSVKIYGVLFSRFIKYLISSLLSAIIELLVFQIFIVLLKNKFPIIYIILSTAIGRIFSWIFNYTFNKKIVFRSSSNNSGIKYLILGCCQLLVSSLLVSGICLALGLAEAPVKIVIDTLLFFVVYFIQSKFVFSEKIMNDKV